jgi:lipopolysaccharide/colanic/teichoic acid biosynthesis glycosyltransferase
VKNELDPLMTERLFFAALLEGNAETLDRVLTEDFILVDVLSGSEINKVSLLAVIGPRQLKFEAIEVVESRVRLYQSTAVITGRTQMKGRFGETPFATKSRYTHVYVQQQGQWRMASAQGTQITAV